MWRLRGLFIGVLGMVFLAGGPAIAAGKIDLVGSWVRTNPADMDGLEFTKDGKVLVYIGDGNDATTADYSILGDGRLNISMGGLANFYVPSMAGDQLQLKEPASGNVAQYRRLKSGETMAAAIAGAKEGDVKVVRDRNAAIPNFLARQDLVMVFINGGPHAPANSAVAFAPNGAGYTGHAIYDGKPLHSDPLTVEMQGSAENPTVAVSFGDPNQNNRLEVLFHAAGSAQNISLTAQVNFEMFGTGPNGTAIIKADDATHKQILDHFKTEAGRLDGLRAPVIAMLKDYAVLKGISAGTSPAERAGFADQFTLARNPQNNTWVGQGQLVNRATGAMEIFPVVAAVGIANEKPVIQIASQKRIYQFSEIDAAGGKLTGAWQMPNNPNGRAAELVITQALDAKGRDKLFAASKAALQKPDLGTVYHAVIADQGVNDRQPPNPIAVTFGAGAGGAITGKVDYPLEGCTMKLSGHEVDTPLGPQLQLQYAGGKANPDAWADAAAFMNSVQHETWIISPGGDPSGSMRLAGYGVASPTPGAAMMTVELIPYTDKDKAAIAAALSDGTKFKVTTPKGPGPDDILTFTADPDGGKIDGVISAGGTHINSATGTKFTGEIKDQSGWTKLVMPITPRSNKAPDYAYTIVVTPTDNGLYINGCVYSTHIGANRPLGRWDAVEVKP